MPPHDCPPRIGLSGSFNRSSQFHGVEVFYVAEPMADWVLNAGGLALVIPPTPHERIEHLVEVLDGLLLHGGVDIAPSTYGEEPLKPEWAGDRKRKKPVFGVCRGMQLINVSLGGKLFQNLASQHSGPVVHMDMDNLLTNTHRVDFKDGEWMKTLYPGQTDGIVFSIHHQGIKSLAPGLKVEAVSEKDGLVEAFRAEGEEEFLAGVQWHPEFVTPDRVDMMSSLPIMKDFLNAALARRHKEQEGKI